MNCDRCGREIPENDAYTHLGKLLCEDCYPDIRSEVKACDPWAVYAATRFRESSDLKGREGLTDQEMQAQLATPRHCEPVKGHKEGRKVYLVPYSEERTV